MTKSVKILLSVLGVGAAAYAVKRYLDNQSSNRFSFKGNTKPDEVNDTFSPGSWSIVDMNLDPYSSDWSLPENPGDYTGAPSVEAVEEVVLPYEHALQCEPFQLMSFEEYSILPQDQKNFLDNAFTLYPSDEYPLGICNGFRMMPAAPASMNTPFNTFGLPAWPPRQRQRRLNDCNCSQ